MQSRTSSLIPGCPPRIISAPSLRSGNGGEGSRPWVSTPTGGCQFSSKNSAGYGSIDGVDASGNVYGPGGAALNSVWRTCVFYGFEVWMFAAEHSDRALRR